MLLFRAVLVLYALVFLGVVTYGLRCGEAEERQASFALLVTAAGSQIVSGRGGHWRFGVEYGVLAFDVVLFLWLLLVVARSSKFWPLWAAAAALVGALTHAARWVSPSLARGVYGTLQPFWVIPVMFAIVIGVLNKRRRS